MNKPLYQRVTSLVQAGLLELRYYLFGLNCDNSQTAMPFLRFRYVKI